MKSSVSIALFFLISAFFLALLLGAVEHSRKLLAISGGCLAAVVCIIIFLTPVELPSFHLGKGNGGRNTAATSTMSSALATTSTTLGTTTTSQVSGASAP